MLAVLVCIIACICTINQPAEEEADHPIALKEQQDVSEIIPTDSREIPYMDFQGNSEAADGLSSYDVKRYQPVPEELERQEILKDLLAAWDKSGDHPDEEVILSTADVVSEVILPMPGTAADPAPDKAEDAVLTVPDKEGSVSLGTAEDDLPEEPAVERPVFTYSGELGMDYCVGSTLDLSGLSWKLGSERISENMLAIGTADTASPGIKELCVSYGGDSVKIPYGVVDYTVVFHGNGAELSQVEGHLWNYRLNESEIEIPVWAGREFTGWYKDAQCTIPFTEAARGETSLDLYAGWKIIEYFVVDEFGYIIDYIGDMGTIRDGVLNIPARSDYVGIAEGAFSSLGAGIYEVYIPANIQYISPGAFDTLTELWYIAVDAENEYYCSEGGVLYTKDMSEIVAVPQG